MENLAARTARGAGGLRRARKGDEEASSAVYAAIRTALLSGQIPPGQKLQEPAIARALGVSRERVRRALHRLAHEGWVKLVPNRGAFLRVPSLAEIEEISDTRRIVESATVGMLATRHDRGAIARLRRHVASEATARAKGQRAAQISLSASFHLLISELTGNQTLLRFQRELMTASQLFYALHSPIELPRCGGPAEHPAIVDAIAAHDPPLAVKLMENHLRDILTHLRRPAAATEFAGFDTVLDRLDR